MILNLSHLNNFIKPQIIQINNAFLAKLDLQDAYLHVPVDSSFQKFLSFTFRGKLFQFRALPFGLSSAPYVFSRMVDYAVQLLRKK